MKCNVVLLLEIVSSQKSAFHKDAAAGIAAFQPSCFMACENADCKHKLGT